jgi:ubiquinone/menaquinone biosynthesis C-methylase UbiE
MKTSKSSYVPAAGYARLTALYDPVMSLTMRDGLFRARLVAAVMAQGPPSRILDLGTGTGSLAIALAGAAPAARITGLDPDPDALARARRKAPLDAGIDWLEGRSEQLPFEDATFDAVCSSLMFHHLELSAKQRALTECLRVLRPGGGLHIADWGAPQDPLMRVAFSAIRLLDGFSRTQAHADGKLPAMIAEVGFAEVRVHERLRTVWGSLELLAARVPVI